MSTHLRALAESGRTMLPHPPAPLKCGAGWYTLLRLRLYHPWARGKLWIGTNLRKKSGFPAAAG